MIRVIRPIGKVSAALKRHGYRQQAVIFVDDKQLEHVAILSRQVGSKLKFEGHFIGPDGELHKTSAYVDMKRAANSIMVIREHVLSLRTPPPVTKPTAKTERAARRSAKADTPRSSSPRRPRRSEPSKPSESALIECKGCGLVHRDDAMCL